MSDYTPTTEEIRRNNWLGTALRSSDHIREDAAFNRWLAENNKQAAKAERERIINLPLIHETIEMSDLVEHHDQELCITCQNIALIKGENK